MRIDAIGDWLGRRLLGPAGAVLLVGLTACAGPQYTEKMAEMATQQAEYVESFSAPPEEVEQVVRRTLGNQSFQIVGGQSTDGPTRFIRGRKGEIGAEDSYWAQVIIRPDADRDGVSTVYIDTSKAGTGTPPSAKPIYLAVRDKLDVASAATVADESTDGADEETEPDESDDDSSTTDRFVDAVPQSSAYALVIGIETYRDLPSPTGAAADARRISRLFRKGFGLPDGHVRTLVDDRATRSDVRAAIDWLTSSVPNGGRIYFYYAGHGSPDPTTSTSLILPYEASQSTLRQTGISLDEIVGEMENSGAQSTIAFIDACFSGEGSRSITAEGERPTVPVDLVDEQNRGASIVYAASESDQISGPNAEDDGGLFTDYLVGALGRGRADIDGDGQITIDELETWVTPRVEREASKLSREQTPEMRIGSGANASNEFPLLWGIATQ